MTSPDDGSRDGSRDDPAEDPPRDFDAEWQAIVENYGDRPTLGEPVAAPEPDPATDQRDRVQIEPSLFDRSHLDAFDREQEEVADRHAEDHFVPPEPPPIPRGTPARRLAWGGLFLPPVLMLAAVAFGWTLPEWASVLLVAGFVGGFVFLVATMPRERGEGDDGAVV